MLHYLEARKVILSNVGFKEPRMLPLLEAFGLVLTREIRAAQALPLVGMAQADGYAVRSADVASADPQQPAKLKLVGRVRAGKFVAKTLGPGEAVQVEAGAPLVEGADAVVMAEDAEAAGPEIRVFRSLRQGDHIRQQGEDVAQGDVILPRGKRLRAQEIALLAALGVTQVLVYPRATVAILTVGPEFVGVGKPAGPGKVRDAGAWMLDAMVRELEATPIHLGIGANPLTLAWKVKRGLEADVFLISSGLSLAAFEKLNEVLTAQGVKGMFWNLDMKPGKPLYFGTRDRTLVFGFPGNPVATFLKFEEFVRPVILRLMNKEWRKRREVTAELERDIRNRSKRVYFVRTALHRTGKNYLVRSAGNQGSHMLRTLMHSNSVVVMEANQQLLRSGERVRVTVID